MQGSNVWAFDYKYPVYVDNDPTKGISEWKIASQGSYNSLATSATTLTGPEWYYVDTDLTIENRLVISGDVKLVLAAKLTCTKGITVSGDGNKLTIYEEVGKTGELVATGVDGSTGIGGCANSEDTYNGGNITINGGIITATGGSFYSGNPDYRGIYGSGIGGCGNGSCNNVIINAGTVTATGSFCAAGLGAGEDNYTGYGNASNIIINDGIVNVKGSNAHGIGCGESGSCNGVYINGGAVKVTGDIRSGHGSETYPAFGGQSCTNVFVNPLERIMAGSSSTFTTQDLITDNSGNDIADKLSAYTYVYIYDINSISQVVPVCPGEGKVGNTYKLSFVTNDQYFTSGFQDHITLSTNTPDIISIDAENETFTGLKEGTANITATLKSDPTEYASCSVTFVQEPNIVFVNDGTAGATTAEGPCMLFDGKYTSADGTKWCTKGQATNEVRFSTQKFVTLTGYKLYTANDNATDGNSGRNPKDWTLYASNDGETYDIVLDQQTGNTIMQDVNYTGYEFTIPTESQGSYKYYKLVINAKQQDVEYFQLGEMQLITSDSHGVTSLGHCYTIPCTTSDSYSNKCSFCGEVDPNPVLYTDDEGVIYALSQYFGVANCCLIPEKTSVTVPSTITYKGELYNVWYIRDNAAHSNVTLEEITIGDGIRVNDYAFTEIGLKKIHLGTGNYLA